MTIPDSCTIFDTYLLIPYDFLKFSLLLTFHSPGWAIFPTKRESKIFGLKNVTEREIREKILTFVIT